MARGNALLPVRLAAVAAAVGFALGVVILPPKTFTGLNSPGYSRAECNVSSSGGWSVYDTDPAHIWNRLFRSLFSRVTSDGREFGRDELDPLLWITTNYLLDGPGNRSAVACLDEFLDKHGEVLITDPLKRVMLQRDLWAVFDWTAARSETDRPAVRDLRSRLAQAIARLALPAENIRQLPNTYDLALRSGAFAADRDDRHPESVFLPTDLLDVNGAWVRVAVEDGRVIAPSHVATFSGRSVFEVFIKLPGGREATTAYLIRLRDFPNPWIRSQETRFDVMVPNPKLPQFPVGTRLALVRRIIAIDDTGGFVPTNIIESVQIRVHRAIPNDIPLGFNTDRDPAKAAMDVYEFKLSRAKLFAGVAGGLTAVAPGEREFPLFGSHGIDLFEMSNGRTGHFELDLRPVLDGCSACHFRPGVHSILSRGFGPGSPDNPKPIRQLVPILDPAIEAARITKWKREQADWRLLSELLGQARR